MNLNASLKRTARETSKNFVVQEAVIVIRRFASRLIPLSVLLKMENGRNAFKKLEIYTWKRRWRVGEDGEYIQVVCVCACTNDGVRKCA